jgi:hypothetical protein
MIPDHQRMLFLFFQKESVFNNVFILTADMQQRNVLYLIVEV